MGISLNGLTPANTYPGLIKTGDNTAISGTPKVLSDGLGNNLPMEVSTTGVNLTGSPTVNSVAIANTTQVAAKQNTLVSGTNIKTVNSTSVLGSGNIAVQETLVSGTNIKTVNSTTILGSGNLAVQDVLVSGTNIKTINGTSVLGSGNIVTPSTPPSGVSGAIQFSDGSAFASDATNLFWNNTTKRLGVGTNNPQDRCEVNGNIRVGASSFVYSSAGGGAVTSGIYLDSSTSKVSVYTNSAERVIFGASTVATIKGSGSTSATTSLLVQNSAGSELFRVRDDNKIISNATAEIGNLWTFNHLNAWYSMRVGDVGYPPASALCEFKSTTAGVLFPRMTTTQKTAISTPLAGLVLYDSTTNKLQCYNGSTWNDLF